MRCRVVPFFVISLTAVSTLFPGLGFSQTQAAQNRIPQQIVINGQMASGAYVTSASGQIQSFTCPLPQQYTTADGNSQGWACYEQTTGVWLLHAVPPSQAQPAPAPAPAPFPTPAPLPQAVPQPPVIYQPAPPVVVYPQPQPAVIYQPAPAPATVIYQQPPAVIYQQPAPTVVYAPAPRPVVVAPAYPSSVVIGRAAINAAGRIASAVILNSHHPRDRYDYYDDHDRKHHNDRNRGRRW
jgi:hypothetical protein